VGGVGGVVWVFWGGGGGVGFVWGGGGAGMKLSTEN